jgi:hypothetical protein
MFGLARDRVTVKISLRIINQARKSALTLSAGAKEWRSELLGRETSILVLLHRPDLN